LRRIDCDPATEPTRQRSLGKIARIAAPYVGRFAPGSGLKARQRNAGSDSRTIPANFGLLPHEIRPSGRLKRLCGLLHSKAAFGIALPIVGDHASAISRMRV
jgi:hypothetical protein